MDTIDRVAVIGSGIGGLAFAACMKSLDTNVKEVVVFDAHDDPLSFNAGGAIGLSGGAAILDRIGCLEDLKRHAEPVQKIKFSYRDQSLLELDLKNLSSNLCSTLINEEDGSPMIFTTRWSALCKVLSMHAFDNEDSESVPDSSHGPRGEEKSSPEQHSFESVSSKKKRKKKHKQQVQKDQQQDSKDRNKKHPENEANQEASNGFDTHVSYQSGKKFHKLIENAQTGKVKLIFDDHSEEDGFDLVIGADGVKSIVRQFTSKPDETILNILPVLGSFLPGSKGNRYTGVRVIQCLTPPLNQQHVQEAARLVAQEEVKDMDRGDTRDSSMDQTTEDILNCLKHKFKGEIHQWCGVGCNMLTMAIGDEGNERYLLAAIYPESQSLRGNFGDNVNWTPEEFYFDKVKHLLYQSGFNEYHELHTILEASRRPGGVVFDIGVHDQIFPLRTWTSSSGRVVLLGDSAHSMTPFLGQGANQAIQDAYCLATLIGKYNRKESLSMSKLFHLQEDWFPRFVILNALVNRALCRISNLFTFLSVVKMKSPNRLQTMAYEYEAIRKFHTSMITLGGRLMAMLVSLPGNFGLFAKIIFFRFLHITGLGSLLFLTPMRPAV